MKRGPLSRAKDAALEKTVLLLLRSRFERYGEVCALSLNTTDKCVTAEVRLRGDPIPIEISQARYRVESKDNGCVITFFEIRTSKEWLQNLLEDRFRELSLNLPAYVRPLL